MNKKLIEQYQCPGCVGCDDGPRPAHIGDGCEHHTAGTTIMPHVGKVLLGMPKGFDRLGEIRSMKLRIFDTVEDMSESWGIMDRFNVPIWKHLDKNGNTLVRGLSPRINCPFIFVIEGDCRDRFDCIEITAEDLEGMD